MKKVWQRAIRRSFFVFMLAAVALMPAVRGQEERSGDEGEGRTAGSERHRPEHDSFNVEVVVEGQPQREYSARGKRYIEAVAGAEYALRVTNPLPVRVAVALSVDGMNTVDARRTTSWDASKWVIMPYQTITISGWQMSSARARRFYFTSERDSYGAKLGQTSNLGVIPVVFFRERERVMPIMPPMNSRDRQESREKSDGATSRSAPSAVKQRGAVESDATNKSDDYAATGIGRSVRHDVRWVALDLERQPAAQVSVRYEYRPELIRLGVLPRRYRVDPLRDRERATGFENRSFSPEP
ncbi:MAG: hypothetical protein WKF30_00280 [Pyrinomonadaceae bacterium]